MGSEGPCETTRELLPEIALGVAGAEERALALEHLAGCPGCAARLAELTAVADDLLVLAPSEEPPAGFEGRVLDRLEAGRARPRWPRIAAWAAGAAVMGVLVAGLGVWLSLSDEREVADGYRATLAEVSGEAFGAASLYAPGDVEVGQVFGYQGSPSWALVTVDSPPESVPSGTYRLQLVTESGERVPFEEIQVEEGAGSEGGAIPIDFRDVAEVRMLGPGPGDAYDARFDDTDD